MLRSRIQCVTPQYRRSPSGTSGAENFAICELRLRSSATVSLHAQPIPVAISVLSECAKELLDLGFGQMLSGPINLVALFTPRRTGRITLLFTLLEPYHCRRHCWPLGDQLIA